MKSLRMSLMHSFVFLPSGVDYGERAVALDEVTLTLINGLHY